MTPLLAQRVGGTDRAFERLYKRHVGDVYRYSLAVLRNPTDAEDVTQTTFMNAYRAFQRGERPEKPQNWLITIAHNACRQRFRQAARRPNEVAFNEDVAEAVPFETEGPSAEDLTRALGYLAFNQRSALVMRELEGRSYAEIAEALDLSVSAVETLLFRARRAIREQLEGSLTCHEAELAISRQVDGRLPRAERGPLRAHLRECKECATFARSQRAQRSAWKGLAAIPLPSSLGSFFGGGGGAVVGTGAASAGFGLGVKAAAVATAAAVAGGVGYEGVKHPPWHAKKTAAAAIATPQQQAPVGVQTSTTAANPMPDASAAVRVSSARSGAEAKSTASGKAKAKAKAKKAKTKSKGGGKAKANGKAKKAKPSVAVAPVAEPADDDQETEVASASDFRKHAKPAKPAKPPKADKPVRAKHEKGRGVGLARSERAARDKTKFSRPAVGLAKSEERSKQKAKAKEKRENKPAAAAAKKKDAGGGNGKDSDDDPSSDPPAEDQNGNGNGSGNGGDNGNGNGNGNGK